MNQDTPPHIDVRGLAAALKRLDRLLAAAVDKVHAALGPDGRPDAYRGLYISREDIARILATEPGHPGVFPSAGSTAREGGAGLFNVAAEIPGLSRIADLFGLQPMETDLLMIALAPELDLRYEQLYAYLQDDVTRRRPSADLALGLLCPDLEAKLAARRHLSPDAPLIRNRLVSLTTDPPQPLPPFLKRSLAADERIVDFILAGTALDADLRSWVRVYPADESPAASFFGGGPDDQLRRLVRDAAADPSGVLLYLTGTCGLGRKEAAADLSRRRGMGLLL
ncbi:hypothetical protein, partial [Desulfococcus sp.]|uniref:hypothetical protein n=1 Tax=Desulfococcus sp. TaxID=2025834 RepID=UPI0035936BF7